MTLSDFDLSKIQRIGLDKIQLSNLAIMWDIDFARLRQKDNNVEIQTTADQERRLAQSNGFFICRFRWRLELYCK